MASQSRWRCLLPITFWAALLFQSRGPTWATGRPDAAVGYYTAALRGAAKGGEPSSAFRRLARLHYRAAELRRQKRWAVAGAVYRTAIEMQGVLPPPKEVPAFATAACSWLNLALTEQNNKCWENARHTFQQGTRMVQELIHRELDVWIDGQNRLRSRSPMVESPDLTTACRWLATLLVAWGLLETKQGHQGRAKVLAARAACLDGSKGKVLSWKVISG